MESITYNPSSSEILDSIRKSVKSAASSAFDEVFEDMKKLEEPEANIPEWFLKFDAALTNIKSNPERYLNDIDEIEKSVQGEEEEATEIIRKWLNNLPVDLGFFYSIAILKLKLMKSLLNTTPRGLNSCI